MDEADRLAAVMARYADMVYSTTRRILGNETEAADVTQETFFQFIRHADRITDSTGAWLHRAATGRAIDLVRQNASRRRREAAYAAETPHVPDSWAEVEPLVDEALASLPDDHRELLVLHFLERQSMTQIAAARGVSQPTISRRVALALDCLRAQLRARGVVVGVVSLSAMLPASTHAAPVALLEALGKISLAHAASVSIAAAGAVTTTSFAVWSKKATAVAVLALIPCMTWLARQPNRSEHDGATGPPNLQRWSGDRNSAATAPPPAASSELSASAATLASFPPVGATSAPVANAAAGGASVTGGISRWTLSAENRFSGHWPSSAGGGVFVGGAGAYVTMDTSAAGSALTGVAQTGHVSSQVVLSLVTNPPRWQPPLAGGLRRAQLPLAQRIRPFDPAFGGSAAVGLSSSLGQWSATQSVVPFAPATAVTNRTAR